MLWHLLQRLIAWLPREAKQVICGYVAPGHHYTLEILRTQDGDGFIVDPLSHCHHCGMTLPQAQYDKAIASYRAMAEEEDEVW